MKDIGDRMKGNYEDRARFYLTRRMPVIIRVDGRAFHTYTRRFTRPFDPRIESAMTHTMRTLAGEAQGCKLAYWQSDEISFLLTDWDQLDTEAWFDYNLAKLCSISASIATMAFNRSIRLLNTSEPGELLSTNAQFDARAFNLPKEEITNYFLWRAKDWYRNSVTMYAQAHFSHRELHGKSVSDMHEMLHQKGLNWTNDLTYPQKNGIFYGKTVEGAWTTFIRIRPRFDEINAITENVLP